MEDFLRFDGVVAETLTSHFHVREPEERIGVSFPPEGFAEQKEGKYCREGRKREPEHPLMIHLCCDCQRERRERRHKSGDQPDPDKNPDPVVRGCIGTSDRRRYAEKSECRSD